ncbi:OLC1v1013675C1 [Oldenlandia corymbosa var. corymbosa]|uniref:OLC1v1013675C1 n=1 Tax=Oldenlandia corymbosa var. corymbosa TaxID=529605 RepID=A0AAV1E0Z5_OLDCO|nr:OLC1v1013675C1 [Oldenlandia corymbosa var. corymbosa]
MIIGDFNRVIKACDKLGGNKIDEQRAADLKSLILDFGLAELSSFGNCLLFILPPLQFIKYLVAAINTVFSEDVSGKVVVITGASSGIGEHMAYEYARRGACLVLAARREKSLREVADRALELGSPDVVVVRADVSNVDDCRRVIDQTMNHFGRLDHLVNNAGLAGVCLLEDVEDITGFRSIMDINFWGSVYMTRFALPYLRNSGGRVVVLSSAASWMPAPRMHVYNASKAALVQFFDTLRVEFGPDIGVTIATPGWIESEMTQGKFVGKHGELELDPEMRDVQISLMPVERVDECAKAIVRGACRGHRYITEPQWFKYTYFWKVFAPELMEYLYRIMFVTSFGPSSTDTLGKKLVDYSGGDRILYPESVRAPLPKTE